MKIAWLVLMLAATASGAEPRTYELKDDLIVCADNRANMRIKDGAKMLRSAKDDRSRESLRAALIGAAIRASERFEDESMQRLREMDRKLRRENPFEEKK